MTYKVYTDAISIRQYTASVNVDRYINSPELYNHIEEVLRERFKDYTLKINHIGKTIRISEKS